MASHSISTNSRLPKIDVHHHYFLPNMGVLYPGGQLKEALGYTFPEENVPYSPEMSLKMMDELGIDLTILSLPDGWPIASVVNAEMAQICKKHPGRFGFFACLPDLRKPEEALKELAYALDELHANGISLSSSYGFGADAKYVGDDAFEPVWAELDRRGAVVFLHGAQTPSSTPYPHPYLGIPITEVPNETYKAAAHLVVTGKKRKYPNVKIILSHLGGSTVWLAPRVAVLSHFMGCPLTEEEILADFKTFYFDTALAVDETTLTAIQTFAGPDRVLFGTDFPSISTDMVKWYLHQVDSFYAERPGQLANIMTENALKLMPELRTL